MLRTRLTAGAQPEPVVADTALSLAAQGHEVTLLAWDRDSTGGAEAQAECMATGDFQRAYEAFAARRQPVFEGN